VNGFDLQEHAVNVQSERDREVQRLEWLENQLKETTEKYFDQRKQVVTIFFICLTFLLMMNSPQSNSRLEMESSIEQKTLEVWVNYETHYNDYFLGKI
jgi:hypothetical protein